MAKVDVQSAQAPTTLEGADFRDLIIPAAALPGAPLANEPQLIAQTAVGVSGRQSLENSFQLPAVPHPAEAPFPVGGGGSSNVIARPLIASPAPVIPGSLIVGGGAVSGVTQDSLGSTVIDPEHWSSSAYGRRVPGSISPDNRVNWSLMTWAAPEEFRELMQNSDIARQMTSRIREVGFSEFAASFRSHATRDLILEDPGMFPIPQPEAQALQPQPGRARAGDAERASPPEPSTSTTPIHEAQESINRVADLVTRRDALFSEIEGMKNDAANGIFSTYLARDPLNRQMIQTFGEEVRLITNELQLVDRELVGEVAQLNNLFRRATGSEYFQGGYEGFYNGEQRAADRSEIEQSRQYYAQRFYDQTQLLQDSATLDHFRETMWQPAGLATSLTPEQFDGLLNDMEYNVNRYIEKYGQNDLAQFVEETGANPLFVREEWSASFREAHARFSQPLATPAPSTEIAPPSGPHTEGLPQAVPEIPAQEAPPLRQLGEERNLPEAPLAPTRPNELPFGASPDPATTEWTAPIEPPLEEEEIELEVLPGGESTVSDVNEILETITEEERLSQNQTEIQLGERGEQQAGEGASAGLFRRDREELDPDEIEQELIDLAFENNPSRSAVIDALDRYYRATHEQNPPRSDSQTWDQALGRKVDGEVVRLLMLGIETGNYSAVQSRNEPARTTLNAISNELTSQLSRYQRDGVRGFVVYGSFARGEAVFSSDIDVVVLVDDQNDAGLQSSMNSAMPSTIGGHSVSYLGLEQFNRQRSGTQRDRYTVLF